MAHIQYREGRHFIDDSGHMFWINGPEDFCYLSEQRQWRSGLSFHEVIEWKQCAPSGLISQRFKSIGKAYEAFENNCIVWSQDLYLRRMGEQMVEHRSLPNYRPTYMRLAELNGSPVKIPPWIISTSKQMQGPRCIWPDPADRTRSSLEPRQKKFGQRRYGERCVKVPAH